MGLHSWVPRYMLESAMARQGHYHFLLLRLLFLGENEGGRGAKEVCLSSER